MSYKTRISNTTESKRALIKSLQDEFTSFSWGGVDAFETFGAFILNDKKGSLKFYNGPGFSNEYTKPQFDSAGGSLQGVTFNKQSISFSIGVYWISIEDYRKLINWLSPLKIDYLQFGFDTKYRYDVKLSKVGDSTRWIIGRENGEPRYYTELSLTFEVQGTPCAKGIHPYEFVGSKDSRTRSWVFTGDRKKTGVCFLDTSTREFTPSDLETPMKINFSLSLESEHLEANYFKKGEELVVIGEFGTDGVLKNIKDSSFGTKDYSVNIKPQTNSFPSEYDISLSISHRDDEDNETKINLASMTIQNLATFKEKGYTLNFSYISETGLMFLQTDQSNPGTLLSLQTYSDTKDFLVKTLQTSKFMLPGLFQYPDFYETELKFILEVSKRSYENNEWKERHINADMYEQYISIECYPRTNVI